LEIGELLDVLVLISFGAFLVAKLNPTSTFLAAVTAADKSAGFWADTSGYRLGLIP
jgi:hypothetical protein